MLDIIRKDLKEAMKARDKCKLTALRNLVSKIKAKEIEKNDILDNDESMKVCLSAAKQIKESIKQYKVAGRNDLVEQEVLELQIIESYLPKQLSELLFRNFHAAPVKFFDEEEEDEDDNEEKENESASAVENCIGMLSFVLR